MTKLITLKNQLQFNLVNHKGRKVQGRYFILVMANEFTLPPHLEQDAEAIYFGLKVSKKFASRAVDRNRTKRRIKHLVRNHLGNNQQGNIKALVIIPRKNFLSANFAELEQEFMKLT